MTTESEARIKVMAADLANSGKRGGKTGARRGSTRRGTKADLGRVSRRAVEGPGRCVHSVTPRGPRQRGGRGWNALPRSSPFPLSPFPFPTSRVPSTWQKLWAYGRSVWLRGVIPKSGAGSRGKRPVSPAAGFERFVFSLCSGLGKNFCAKEKRESYISR